MRTEYRLTIVATCPVDGSRDVYKATVTVEDRVLPVEEILAAVERVTSVPTFQEVVTGLLANALGAHVRTVGTHSNVEATCEAGRA